MFKSLLTSSRSAWLASRQAFVRQSSRSFSRHSRNFRNTHHSATHFKFIKFLAPAIIAVGAYWSFSQTQRPIQLDTDGKGTPSTSSKVPTPTLDAPDSTPSSTSKPSLSQEVESEIDKISSELAATIDSQDALDSPTTSADEGDNGKGAFDPETGEINWDCPCLGGMADGPCGEEFKTAFSCFVYSTDEPKGMECIDKFSAMQECFRKYPEVYADELRETEAAAEGEAEAEAAAEAEDHIVMSPDVDDAMLEEAKGELESMHARHLFEIEVDADASEPEKPEDDPILRKLTSSRH